jgi:hypothetical protein
MNSRDSRGFDIEFELEFVQSQRCLLIGYPSRDLREWVVRGVGGHLFGFVHQEGNSRFRLLNDDAIWVAAYANLDQAVRTVEIADFIRCVSGITSGFLQ